MSAADIRDDREQKESRARGRVQNLPPGDYYASGNNLCRWESGKEEIAVECESHTDAVLALIALGRGK